MSSNPRDVGPFSLPAALVAVTLLAGCASVPVPAGPPAAGPAKLEVADFDAFLHRHVDDQGRVDYAAAASDRADLDRFVIALAASSPDSDPAAFGSEASRLAYWIAAYNAWVIVMVLEEWPIETVREVNPTLGIEGPAGFFFLQRVLVGGDRLSLWTLENRIVRKRFDEPRIHFALNCASIGCPRLPAEAFTKERLEEQLTRETLRFLSEERNVSVDLEARVVHLSEIFDWYASDFTGWLERHRPGAPATLLGYLQEHAPAPTAERVAACADCAVAFTPYDWGVNAQPAR
jgi:hypothetical protein